MDRLHTVVRKFPVIDNHCHNLLSDLSSPNHAFESIVSEARGGALEDSAQSLARLRAEKQLKDLYLTLDTGTTCLWEDLQKARNNLLQSDQKFLLSKCLDGVNCMLIDDGFGNKNELQPYRWHGQFTHSPAKRILRIESLAEGLLSMLLFAKSIKSETDFRNLWGLFKNQFISDLVTAIQDTEVVAFKSVICYRSGLEISDNYASCSHLADEEAVSFLHGCQLDGNIRFQSFKSLNDYLVLQTLELINSTECSYRKPIQLHTGHGDTDLELRHANPVYLQRLVESYPNVPFVLLHSGYPYTREAGYLTAQYSNVYLDLGLVFPMISKDGQVSILRQSLELAPYKKLLFSTDGHFFPETYWLSIRQFREALDEVLVRNVNDGSLDIDEAIDLATSIFFHNSNKLYCLQLSAETDLLPEAFQATEDKQDLQPMDNKPDPLDPQAISDKQVLRNQISNERSHISLNEDFITNLPRFVAVQWVDFLGIIRSQIVSCREFKDILHGANTIAISQGNLGTLQDDTLTSFANTTGQIYLHPALNSGRRFPKEDGLSEMGSVMSSFGVPSSKLCPRLALNNLVYDLTQLYESVPLLGFEIEFTLLRRRNISNNDQQHDQFVPIDDIHAWGTMSAQQWRISLPIITEIVEKLENCGIYVDKFHSESGYGQYEISLKPSEPLLAIDTLYQARQIITQTSAKYDVHATFHPWPLEHHPRQFGSGAHAHISLNPKPGGKLPSWVSSKFLTGVLDHMEAICAFTMPEGESYRRIRENAWTCGTYIGWGSQNREVPIRRSGPMRYEIRCLDGFANMYLAIAAIFAGGLLGIKARGREYVYKDCPGNPSKLTEGERKMYGINRKMPTTIYQSLEALSIHDPIKARIGKELAEGYIVMKREEQSHLTKMGAKAHHWLVERY